MEEEGISLQARCQAGPVRLELTNSQSLLAVNYFELKWQAAFIRRAARGTVETALADLPGSKSKGASADPNEEKLRGTSAAR